MQSQYLTLVLQKPLLADDIKLHIGIESSPTKFIHTTRRLLCFLHVLCNGALWTQRCDSSLHENATRVLLWELDTEALKMNRTRCATTFVVCSIPTGMHMGSCAEHEQRHVINTTVCGRT